MRLLGRLILGALALILAIPAGAAMLVAALALDPAAATWLTGAALAGLEGLADLAAGLPPDSLLPLLAEFARALFVLLALPPILAALAGEALGRRSLAWYGGVSGAITAAIPWLARGAVRAEPGQLAAEARLTAILFLAGATAGLVYWLIAGRSAGPVEPET